MKKYIYDLPYSTENNKLIITYQLNWDMFVVLSSFCQTQHIILL